MLDRIEDFRVISSIYKSLSLTVSAEEFNISPATMSKKLSSIEGRLGQKLFYRSTRKFSPTEEGELYYRYAIEVLDKIDSFHKNQETSEPEGLIKISASTTFARLYLMPLVDKFLKKYPKVKIELILSDQITDIINEGIDMAIRVAPLKDSSLISTKLGSGKKVLCASKKYLDKNGIPKTPNDLKDHNCIVLGNNNTWTFVKGKKEHTLKVRGNLKVNYGEMLAQAVSADMGIAFLSLWLVHKEIEKGKFVPVLKDYAIKNQAEVYLVYPDRVGLAQRNRIFIDFLKENLKIPE